MHAPAIVGRDLELPRLHVHGFIGQGAFVSTANDYIGHSSRGSTEWFQAGLTVSSELTDQLRVGMQLFTRDEGLYGNYTPSVDWAFLDYHWRDWLGLRAGHTKIPFGLYNEYVDIDAARVPILLPQSMYPIGNREVLLAQTGLEVYGRVPLRRLGELEYEAYGGSLFVPLVENASRAVPYVYQADTKYVVGGQLFYHPPLDGLKVGASVLRASIDFSLDLDPATTAALIAAGLEPPTFNGQATEAFRPVILWVASAEYARGDWLFQAEYARWYARVVSSLLPTSETRSERYYALASYRLSERLQLAAYYSVFYPDVHDRSGAGAGFKQPFFAHQRDADLSVRLDINPHWLFKVEGHFIDGVASLFDGAVLDPTLNPDPSRYWGLFLVNTTVTF